MRRRLSGVDRRTRSDQRGLKKINQGGPEGVGQWTLAALDR
jgi:hypothetical protein